MNKEIPRCDKCERCEFKPSKKHDGYTHYCALSGRDVGQSHFGHNSPKVCPLRQNNCKLCQGVLSWTQFLDGNHPMEQFNFCPRCGRPIENKKGGT